MKRLFTTLLLVFMATCAATAQQLKMDGFEYKREYQAAVERILQRLAPAMAKLETGDSTVIAEVASLESSMAYVLIQSQNDYKRALPWVRRCISRKADLSDPGFKYEIAKAHTMLALYYDYGLAGVEKDSVKAFGWYEKAAHMGDSQAMYEIGLAYHSGGVVVADEKKAFEWWLASANNGYYDAYRNVAIEYYFGTGVKQNYAEAVKWAEKGMKTGDGYCILMLGVVYYKGEGVKCDYGKAFECFSLAARQGETGAYQSIAECYYYGRGVERDYEQAKEWCQKGIEAQDEEAVKFMRKLKNK